MALSAKKVSDPCSRASSNGGSGINSKNKIIFNHENLKINT